jgi:cell division protein FtsW
MNASTTHVGDRRRIQHERNAARTRHPSGRGPMRAFGPPPTTFYVIAAVVVVFTMLGLAMVLSASSIREFHNGNSPWRIFSRQAMWAALGMVSLLCVMRIPYGTWRRLVGAGLVVAVGLMILPFVPGVGMEVNDATAWVSLGSFSFQPSEFMKLAVVLYCADLMAKRTDELHDVRRTLWPMLLVAAGAGGLCLAQGDLGSAIVLVAVVFTVAFVAGTPLLPMVGALAVSGAAAAVFVFSSQYRYNRFTAFFDIEGNREHLSYQTFQAMIGIANGGTTGAGPGRGVVNIGDYLPLAHSDFIFAVIAEELGLVGVIAVIGGFAVLAFCGIQVALAARDPFGTFLAGGIVGWLIVQTLINVGGVTGMMPVTGLTLPFFSAGGSSLFVTLTAAGLLLNVARHAS